MDECYIVAGGPSLIDFDWSLLDDKFVIAINNSYQKLPNAQIVYFTDDDWYEQHKENLKLHSGQLIKGSLPNKYINQQDIIEYALIQQSGLVTEPLSLAHGNNSTYAAINLAGIHLNFNKIFLLGVDMQYDGDNTHWHKGHIRIDPPNTYKAMLNAFDTIVQPLLEHGIKVININTKEQTKLDIFPIKPFIILKKKV